MNKTNFFQSEQTDFPLTTETLDFLQNTYSEVAAMLVKLGCSVNYILSGCKVSGGNISAGAVVIDGEILAFKQGAYHSNVLVRENASKAKYRDGVDRNTYFTRYAECGVGVGVSFSSLKRLKSIYELDVAIQNSFASLQNTISELRNSTEQTDEALLNSVISLQNVISGLKDTTNQSIDKLTEATNNNKAYTVPKGGIIMWSGHPTTIPSGWALCDGRPGTPDLSGRFVVGYSKDISYYDWVGNKGGHISKELSIANLPEHAHRYTVIASDGTEVCRGSNYTNTYEYIDGKSMKKREVEWHDQDGVETGKATGTTWEEGKGSPNIAISSQVDNNDTSYTGLGIPFDLRPPYYTICYIIKL